LTWVAQFQRQGFSGFPAVVCHRIWAISSWAGWPWCFRTLSRSADLFGGASR